MVELAKSIDSAICHFINHILSNSLLDYIMAFLTEMGSIYFALGIGLILLLSRRKQPSFTGLILIASILLTRLAYEPIKGIVARPRPFEIMEGVHLPCGESLGFSFPSGHTTVAFIVAVILSSHFRKWRKVFYSLAVTVAISRIYIGVHYPSDVIGGAMVGVAVGLISVALIRRITEEKRRA